MAEYARNEINEIGGYYAYGKELINGTSVFNFDITKLNNNKVIYPRVYDTYLQNYFKENNINVEVPVVTTSTISSLEMGRLMKTFVIAPMPEKEKINIFTPVYRTNK